MPPRLRRFALSGLAVMLLPGVMLSAIGDDVRQAGQGRGVAPAGRPSLGRPAAPSRLSVARRPTASAPSAARSSPTGAAGAAAELLMRASAQLAQLGPLEAQMRQRVQMYGQQLVGAGRYRQSGPGKSPMSRMDLKLQLGDKAAAFQQVFDGQYLWIRRDHRQQVAITRADLNRQLESASVPAHRSIGAGLPRLLAALAHEYSFAAPRKGQLQGQAVWRLRGRRAPPASADPRHPHLPPTQVEVVLGQDPPFPYRIAMFNDAKGRLSGEQSSGSGETSGRDSTGRAQTTPVMMVEFYEVRFRAPLAAETFTFDPGDVDFQDVTSTPP